MAQQIPLHTLLGDRYKVTAHVLETADGDTILDGVDQILNRKVSIVVASAEHSSQLVANARQSASLSRSSVQILDLGNVEARTYLVTSHARPDTLLTTLLTEGGGEAEEFGEEIFGDTGTMSAPNTYVVAKDTKAPAAGAGATTAATSISATRAAAEPEVEPAEEYEEYDAEEDGYYEDDEPAERNGGMWAVGIAAVLVLVIGVGVVFASLGNMVDPDETQKALGGGTSTSSSASEAPQQTSSSASPSPSATDEEKEPEAPRLDGDFTRTVPSSANLMAEADATLGHLTDSNNASTWVSLAFGSANFGGLTDSFYFSAPLREETTVNSLTINQVSGTGGAFNVFASNDASIEGAQQVGSGTFAATGETTVKLDQDVQDGNTKYIIVQFTEAPRLAQPIVQGYPFGLRLAEISVE